jgi:energy-coupling factor transporter ATP-binding protein EcfA2
VAPPVVQLGRLAGWDPLPLSVRDARRAAGPLRERLADVSIPPARCATTPSAGSPALTARNIVVRYGDTAVVRGVNVDLARGQVSALMGRNGSGKSSLLWALQGSGRRQSGTVDVGGTDPRARSASDARRLVGLVPQTPADLLYLETVDQECAQADREAGGVAAAADGDIQTVAIGARLILDRLAPGIAGDLHPRDLSEGQRLALVLAVQLSATPQVILLDEPTRGLDYHAKRELVGIVDTLAGEGRAVVIATHDVEFAALAAERVIVMAQGDIVADGPTAEVLVASPAFAPQVTKVVAPLAYLTVDQVAAGLRLAAGLRAEN